VILYYVTIILAFNNGYRAAIAELAKNHNPIEKAVLYACKQ
jgi:hypothetical protein